MGEEKRHEMMQNLFGDQSEEEEEIDSEHESNPHPNYASTVIVFFNLGFAKPDPGESEGERVQSSQEVDIGDQREESEAKETDSDEKEDYGQRVVTSRRREVIESGSERSEENHYPDNEDEEVDQTRSLSKSPEEEKDPTHLSHSAAEIRDVFVRHDMEQEEIRSPMEEEGSYGKSKFLLSLKRIRLENNIVRWRTVRKKDGTTSYESNARFVRWSDGSLQLLIGNEVLDISVQEAQHDQSHLFLRHGKVTISS
ncbi:hypothetical protein GOBAR_AA35385 [Gossypium barbadense]|uniref:Leo1-like protein n=1 Tax=Gossypium barbadense TaxID=3634 RepID=A0A2P5W2J4_GOSBA|nr:hypothetical protein GOBAR_AA35385 [Gossypium barbadense]